MLDLCGERGKWSVGFGGNWWNWVPGMDGLGGGLGPPGFFVIYAELGALLFSGYYVKGVHSLVSNSGTSCVLQVKQLVP